ncbi:MAG: hypothetical protein RL514_1059 [Verrucomicrobiota bacterium]|jgi:hypothetical protein
MIERHFEVPFVSRLALREKQIQQNYRPVIAVHKWFARSAARPYRSLWRMVGQPLPRSELPVLGVRSEGCEG